MIKRIYHHYLKWEEYHAGMWSKLISSETQQCLDRAIDFTRNTKLYGEWMMKVIEKWPNSCEQNLTEKSMNRKAWIGHAACCLAIGCPEYITRKAWVQLTQEQQDDANARAQMAIDQWMIRHRDKLHNENQLCFQF
jgi:hypothetical protein